MLIFVASSGCGASDTKTYRGNGFTFAYPARWRLMAGIAAPLPNAVLRAQRRFVGVDGQDWIVGLRAPDLPTAVLPGNVGQVVDHLREEYAAFMAKIQTARVLVPAHVVHFGDVLGIRMRLGYPNITVGRVAVEFNLLYPRGGRRVVQVLCQHRTTGPIGRELAAGCERALATLHYDGP